MATVPSAPNQKVARSNAPPHANVVYDRTASVDEQLRELTELYGLDSKAEKKRKALGWTAAILVVIGVLTAALYVGVVFLVLALAAVVWRWRIGRRDLEDRKLHAARLVLETFAPELSPGSDVEVHLDFRGYQLTVPSVEQALKAGGARVYTEPGWLKLAFALLDGTRVSVQASTSAKREQRRERNDVRIEEDLVEELEIELRAPSGDTFARVSDGHLKERLRGTHGLSLERAEIAPTVAGFLFRTPAARRVSEDNRWRGTNLEALLDGHGVLEAIRACCGAVKTVR